MEFCRARRAPDDTRPAMLGDLHVRDLDVFAWCNRCSHNEVVSVRLLIARLGPTVPVPEVGSRMRCTGCGSNDVATRPDWPGLGIVAGHGPSGRQE